MGYEIPRLDFRSLLCVWSVKETELIISNPCYVSKGFCESSLEYCNKWVNYNFSVNIEKGEDKRLASLLFFFEKE